MRIGGKVLPAAICGGKVQQMFHVAWIKRIRGREWAVHVRRV